MSIKPIEKPPDGERVLAISPETANAAAADWLRRPNLFPGRALTAPTLEQRQRWQAGRIAVRSQAFTRGVASGLEVSYTIEPPAAPGARGIVRLQITPGRALTWSGEDVVLATSSPNRRCLLKRAVRADRSRPLRAVSAFSALARSARREWDR